MTLTLAQVPSRVGASAARPALAEQPIRLPDLPLLVADVPQALRVALSQEGVPCQDYVPGSRAGRFVLYDSTRLRPRLGEGQRSFDVDELRRIVGGNVWQELADERAGRFAWQIGPLAVEEVVARADRAALRWQLMSKLRAMVEAAGGLWMSIAAFPHPYQTAFNFRIDHDEYDAGDFAATLAIAERHADCVSHYVCASTHVRHSQVLQRLRGMHVGSHGFWHHTYRDASANLTNVSRGIDALAAAGIVPQGFAAPLGRFNRGLLAALESLCVSHSSEFGLAFDDLPFFPAGSSVLQIPIHPVCLGLCLDAAGSRFPAEKAGAVAAETALRHFLRMARDKHQAREPVFFYGHPAARLGRFPHLLRELFDFVGTLDGVWRVTLAEFAKWWTARAKISVQAFRRNGQIEVVAERCPVHYSPAVDYWRGDRAATLPLMNGRAVFACDAPLGEPRRPLRDAYPRRVARRWGWRDRLCRYLDWEYATPLEEIATHHWRGRTKRLLREVKA